MLRALLIKQPNGFSYRELSFHLADSNSYGTFCRLGMGQGPSKTVLAACIKAIPPETLEKIHRLVIGVACKQKIEDGARVRVDMTVVESNIHTPLDSNLLWDCVRVLTRPVEQAREAVGEQISFPNRTRRARPRALGILNARFKRRPFIEISCSSQTRQSNAPTA